MAQNDVKYRVLVLGGSAGSLDIVLRILAALPADSNACFVVVLHRKNDPDSILSELIASRTDLPVKEVEDKEPIQPNCIYLAPGGYHLLLENEQTFSLDSSEKVNFSMPSIDVSFSSVADVFGSAAVAVLLSGANSDGAEGMKKIRQAGGLTIAQDPATAVVGFMPRQAIEENVVDKIVDGDQLPQFIRELFYNSKTKG